MADEVFALSPIAARPVQPGEADYDAIKEAFMETSRGRWFLGEYAKRNRNADTRMVLDAVSRIEETIAAQKKPVRDPVLDEALLSLRAALSEARDAASAAVDSLAIEQNLAPVRKGARVIREIAWRLREIGADGRICDLIDSQVAAIEGAASKLSPSDLEAALVGAFDRIEGKIATLDGAEATAPASPPAARPSEAMNMVPPAEPGEAMQASLVTTQAQDETANKPVAAAGPTAADEPSMATAAPPSEPVRSETALSEAASEEPASGPVDAFDVNDEAMLDMVAMEMAAPDTDEAYEPRLEDADVYERQIYDNHVAENRAEAPQPEKTQAPKTEADATPADAGSWEIDVTFESSPSNVAEPPVVAAASPAVTPLQPEPQPEPAPLAAAASAPSLGSSLLASGIVTRPRTSGHDPLAPIRRMSQNEKIAFFS